MALFKRKTPAQRLFAKGMGFAQRGKWKKALGYFVKYTEKVPDDATGWFWVGISLSSLGRLEEAFVHFDKALALDPRKSGVWGQKGIIFENARDLEKALNCYNFELKNLPTAVYWYHRKAVVLTKQKKLGEALQCVETALKIQPKFKRAALDRKLLIAALKAPVPLPPAEIIEARQPLPHIVAAEEIPPPPEAFTPVQPIELPAESPEKKAEEIPPHPGAIEAYEKGTDRLREGKFKDAIKWFDRALKMDSNFAPAWFRRGESFAQLRRFADAMRSFQKALKLFEDTGDADSVETVKNEIGKLKESVRERPSIVEEEEVEESEE